MNEKSSVKRFVAGATCPQCGELDTTVCYYQDQVFVRECVECDFREKITGDENAEPEGAISPAQIIKIKEL